jgi:DNA-binding transcriptional ArsR family regulator
METSQLLWDWGTAYDLFISLGILHKPSKFGLRGAWAAGMRARLPTDAREMLEQSQSIIHLPFHWIYTLPEPKDGATVLWVLGQIPSEERLPTLALTPDEPGTCDKEKILRDVAARGAWDEKDQAALQDVWQCEHEEKGAAQLSKKDLVYILDWWSRPGEFGDRYLEALRAYQEVFFAEEEKRIQPALQEALARAQELAEQLALPDLLEELSQGVRIVEWPKVTEIVLAPSYWTTPLLLFGNLSAERQIWLFGARPPDASLVPGQTVPDAMLRALKALSDPTRLRILRYLAQESLTPAQLARRLRLRAPTVTHHLKTLRLAGLLQLTLEGSKDERRYATRSEAVAAAFESLKEFLETNGMDAPWDAET